MTRKIFALALALILLLVFGVGAVASPIDITDRQEIEIWTTAEDVTRMVSGARAYSSDFIQTGSGVRHGMRAAAWRPLDGTGLRFEHDSTNFVGSTEVRLIVNQPELMTEDMLVSAWVAGSDVDWVRRHIDRFFRNVVQVVQFDHTGEFGQTVRVAARINLRGMLADELVFYNFDREANVLNRIAQPNYRIDANGFVWFDTDAGDFVVISSTPLIRR